ncbi:MAG: hypothetical protein MMC23_006084 [Stictis urceolatum]|nr:hypothetical protein [Stictis urceolata]
MHLSTALSLFISSDLALAATLWATHYDGTVSKLSLGSSGLTLAAQEKTCGSQPSWLTYDASTKTLYCVDEFNYGGTLSAYDISSGSLVQTAKANIIGNGVHSGLYGGPSGDSFMAIAH